ncbi:hypothetical protein EGH24_03560 [Halonotius terrestris]|uniref:Uncharacterized protein n=1 Tax=Halonotius terrestris TaxID=2487750 RepID=A0A8J8P986_9EURY|nr:hypothetical protein [Halonotius terrestris]TQQ82544.1 hypothetical protein EGH24_03560 [Halonotius terrestris]
MRFSDSRGQSLQIGAILLFGFLLIAVTTAQAHLVPADISRAELDHSQRVADQLVGLETAIFETSVTGRPQPATLDLGPTYDDRLLFVYPPPQAGTLRTTEPATLHIDNAEAVGDDDAFATYWNGTTRSYVTRALTYEPAYRELDETPRYRIEHGVLAAQHESDSRIEMAANRQPVVDDTDLSLLVVDGELAAAGLGTESVVPERVTDSTTVEIEDSGDPIRLRLPTELSAETWRETILDGQAAVDSVAVAGDVVTITLDSAETYELTLHKIDIGTNAAEPSPTYLRNATADADWPFPVDVRDRYNDRVADTTTVYVYNDSDYDSPEASFTVPDGSDPAVAGDLCYTLTKDVVAADAPETVESTAGGCA